MLLYFYLNCTDLLQMNEITPWMDGGLTYGVNKAWADGLRLFRSNCPERNPSSPDYVPNILAGEVSICRNKKETNSSPRLVRT